MIKETFKIFIGLLTFFSAFGIVIAGLVQLAAYLAPQFSGLLFMVFLVFILSIAIASITKGE